MFRRSSSRARPEQQPPRGELAELDPDVMRVLRAAAVVGNTFGVETVARLEASEPS